VAGGLNSKIMASQRRACGSLKDIVKDKHVVCLECDRKMRALKAHTRKSHKLLPKEYFQRYSLDPKKFPLVCKDYSKHRRKLAMEGGLGAFRRKLPNRRRCHASKNLGLRHYFFDGPKRVPFNFFQQEVLEGNL
jgi:predicted transcriptional regulator